MKIIILSLFLLLICLFIWSVIIEPNILTVKHLQIKDEQLKGAKIVFASDFHIKPYENYRLERIIRAINKQNADIVLFGGDYVSGHKKGSSMTIDKIAKSFSNITSKHGTYAIIGNHDGWQGKEEIVKQMQKDGHLIGNHTYDHVQLDKLPNDQACQQIIKTNNEIYEITGEYPMYLRPPYGAWPKDLELCVTMLPVFWDVDTLDWKSKNVQSVENIVQREVKDGSIILMHDSFSSSVEAALQIADMLTEQGYDLVTADELLVM